MKNNLQIFIEKVAQFFQNIFGQVQYQKPSWIEKISSLYFANPARNKKIKQTLVGVLLVAVVGYFAKSYYDTLPKDETVKMTVRALAPYNFEKPEVRPLFISFSHSVANVNMVGKNLVGGVQLKPEIKGQWVWASDRVLKFTPITEKGKIDWHIGKKYTGVVSKKILSGNLKLESDEFEFETEPLRATVVQSEFYQDPRFPENKRVVATFYFNYPVLPESLKKRLQISEKSEGSFSATSNADTIMTFDDKKSQMFVQSSQIKINNSNREFKITLEKGFSSVFDAEAIASTETVIKVPSLYDYFQINQAQIVIVRNEKFESEQILRIENVSGIASEELAKVLEVYELPYYLDEQQKKEKSAEKKQEPYAWASVSEVTPDVLQKSKKIKLGMIPTEKLISEEHSFQISSVPGRSLFVKIPKETTSFGGFKLKDDYEKVIRVPAYPSDLQIMGKGSILPMSGKQSVSIVSRNVNKIKFEINQIRMEQINHLIPGLVGDFTRPDLYEIRPNRISEMITGEIPLLNKNPQKSQFSSIQLSDYLSDKSGQRKKGLFLINLSSKDSEEFVTDQRFILISDIGMIVKKTVSQNYEVFVQNIHTGLPIAGAKISVLGQNGLTVLSAESAANGSVTFPNLKDFKNDKEPIAFLAQYGESLSFVPYNAYSREMDLTSFDIGGVRDSSESDQLNAFIFSDRGIYRPGEKSDFGFVVRSKNWNKVFSQIPVDVVIQNPTGQEVLKETIKVSSNSMESISFKTEDYFPTGVYNLYVYIQQANKQQLMLGSTTFQVEEFLPDQIKVRTSLSNTNPDGWVSPEGLKLNLSAYNLYGKPATDRTAKSKIRIKAADVYFKKWKDYSFNTPKVAQLEMNDVLEPRKTNENGEVEWPIQLQSLDKSIYRLTIESEVFETDGGKSVKSQLSQLVSSQSYFLGYKSQLLDLSFVKKETKANLDILTVNSKLDSIAVKNITADLIERKPTSVLTKLPNETYAYQTVYKEKLIKSVKFDSLAKNTILPLETQTVGEFILVFKDSENTELNRLTYNVVGNSDLERGLEKSSLLKIGLNKKDYKPNEDIEIQIKSPYAGAGLITIERDKVYESKWFKTSSKSTVEKIKIPAGLEGQAYIVVTMLRDYKSEDIYTSPLAYGAASFAIDLEARKSQIDIAAPDVVKPGQTLTFKVKASQKTKAAVYLVDEGILQVAHYKLPQPLNYFFQKKALQVNTYQILDLVMPDFSLLSPRAAGGDESGLLGQSINPFKRKNIEPIVHWFGINEITPAGTSFQYKVPDYFNGNMKLMVVSADDQKLGSTSTDVNVRGDFIINATTTSFSAPGDEFEVNLIIANQLKGSGEKAEIQVDASVSAGLSLSQDKIPALAIPENKEKSISFKVKAKELLGSQSIVVSAGMGQKKSKIELTLSNRPPVPYQQKMQWLLLSEKPVTLTPFQNQHDEFRQNFFQAHTTIQNLIKPFSAYYEINDYLCSEQIAGQLMPLALKNEKSKDEKLKMDRLISLLRARQSTEGSFHLYPSDSQINFDTSLHLGMIFLYMQEKGEKVPQDLWQRYLQSLKSDYNQTQTKLDLYRKAKSIYILVRSQYVPKVELKNMATLIQNKNTQKDISQTTAMYLAASFKLAQQDDMAQKALSLAEKNKDVQISDQFIFENTDAFERDALMVRHFSANLKDDQMTKLFGEIIQRTNTHSMNTYSTSYLMMSLDLLLKQSSAAENLDKLTFKVTATDKSVVDLKLDKSKKLDLDSKVAQVVVQNQNTKPVILSYFQAGFDQNSQMLEQKNGLEVSRSIENDKNEVVKSVEIGQELTVKIRARVSSNRRVSTLINDLLPAGFEVVLNSVRKNSVDTENTNDVDPANGPMDGEGADGEGEGSGVHSEEIDTGALFKFLPFMPTRAYAQAAASVSTIPSMITELVDVREDRVNIYTTLDQNMTEYTYQIKAIAKGRFLVPGIYARGMYLTDMTGQGATTTIEVK